MQLLKEEILTVIMCFILFADSFLVNGAQLLEEAVSVTLFLLLFSSQWCAGRN